VYGVTVRRQSAEERPFAWHGEQRLVAFRPDRQDGDVERSSAGSHSAPGRIDDGMSAFRFLAATPTDAVAGWS